MRLSDKVMAVVLAAAVSVSMLTACSGGGGGGGNNGSSSSTSSSSSSSASSDSTSGGGAGGGSSSSSKPSSSSSSSSSKPSGSSSSSASSSSSSDSSSSSSTDADSDTGDDAQVVKYKDSYTKKFLDKLSNAREYTISFNAVNGDDSDNYQSGMNFTTDGVSSFTEIFGKVAEDELGAEDVAFLVKKGLLAPQAWEVISMDDDELEEEGIDSDRYDGIYGKIEIEEAIDADMMRDVLVENLRPVEGVDFTYGEDSGEYYELQTVNDGAGKVEYLYAYKTNRSGQQVLAGAAVIYEENDRVVEGTVVEFNTLEFEATQKWLDFDNILQKYYNINLDDTDSLNRTRKTRGSVRRLMRDMLN